MSTNDPEYSRTAQRKIAEQKNKKRKGHGTLKKILFSLFGVFLVGLIIGGTMFFVYAKSAPKLSAKDLLTSNSTTIYDSQGSKILSLGSERRSIVTSSDLPQLLKDAVVSIEDRRFYKHNGIDIKRIVSATVSNARNDSGLQGGSTLDQQLIKLSYFSTKKSDQTLKRKAQEAWLAINLDKKYSKDQILTFYVNKVFMGNGVYGMETASQYYYGKSLKDLTLAQTALIAGIPNAPSTYNPYANKQLATSRRNEVLKAMLDSKKISDEEFKKAIATDISLGLRDVASHSEDNRPKKAVWADGYLKQVIKDVQDKGYNPYSDSLKIYTNLNTKVQERLYDLANTNERLLFPDNRMQVAATIIDPNNGNVIAMLGGRKISKDVTYGLNRAVQKTRTNASTAKPLFDYAPTIEFLSWATYHKLEDTPYTYPGTNHQLNDFDFNHKGDMTMQDALIQSRNIPAVKALASVGVNKAQNFINRMGFEYDKPLELQNGIGLPSSTLQNAAAYSVLANGGTYYKPSYISSIETSDGEVKDYSHNEGQQAMKDSTAYMITDMLKQVITSPSGTGKMANIAGLYQAGKTGTNAYPSDIVTGFPKNAVMDSWFNGYTKHYSVSIWMGYDRPFESENYLSGSSVTLPIVFYRNLMAYLSQSKTNTDWKRPSNVYVKKIDGIRYLYLAGSNDTNYVIHSSSIKSSESLRQSSIESSVGSSQPESQQDSSSLSSVRSEQSSTSAETSTVISDNNDNSSSNQSVVQSQNQESQQQAQGSESR